MSIVETEAVACCVAFWQAAAADHFREESFSSNSEAYDDIADKFNVLRHSVDAVDASLRSVLSFLYVGQTPVSLSRVFCTGREGP